jgi:hypothetical protein
VQVKARIAAAAEKGVQHWRGCDGVSPFIVDGRFFERHWNEMNNQIKPNSVHILRITAPIMMPQ